MKQCNKCKEWKSLDGFHKDSERKDGRRARCKACDLAARQLNYTLNPEKARATQKAYRERHRDLLAQRARQYREQNPDRVSQRERRYRERHREKIVQQRKARYWKDPSRYRMEVKEYRIRNRDRVLQQEKQNRERNRDSFREKRRQAYQQNRSKELARNLRYRQQNPEANRARVARRKARIMGSGGSYTAQEWKALCAKYNHRCLCCNRQEPEIKLTPDHVVPIALGGSNDIDNIQPLCLQCNQRKWKTIADYRPK